MAADSPRDLECLNFLTARTSAQGGCMKYVFIAMALSLAACAHETTTMDRELALKLADKTPVIVQSAPPVINVNYNSGSAPQPQPIVNDPSKEACNMSPDYDVNGNLKGYVKHCYGG